MQTYQETLTKLGLTKDQSAVYSALLKKSPLPNSKIAIEVGIKRPLCHLVVEQLINLGLITKIDKKVATFIPNHPNNLKKILEDKIKSINETQQELDIRIGEMVSDYNIQINEPYVEFREGVSGLKYLYDDIIKEKKDIKLIRSTLDSDNKELLTIVLDQIQKQVKNNIHVRGITPLMGDTIQTVIQRDTERLTTRKIVKKEDLSTPAQILIYGDKVGITSFKEPMITTITYNEPIRETMEKIFEFIWDKGINPEDLI